jgi:hypothetical protein
MLVGDSAVQLHVRGAALLRHGCQRQGRYMTIRGFPTRSFRPFHDAGPAGDSSTIGSLALLVRTSNLFVENSLPYVHSYT